MYMLRGNILKMQCRIAFLRDSAMDWDTFSTSWDIWAWIRTFTIIIFIIFGWRISKSIADKSAHRSEIRDLIAGIMDLIHKVKLGFSDLLDSSIDCEIRKAKSVIIFSYIDSINKHIDFLRKYGVKLKHDKELMAEFLHVATLDIEDPDRVNPKNVEKISKLDIAIRIKLEEAFFEKYKMK